FISTAPHGRKKQSLVSLTVHRGLQCEVWWSLQRHLPITEVAAVNSAGISVPLTHHLARVRVESRSISPWRFSYEGLIPDRAQSIDPWRCFLHGSNSPLRDARHQGRRCEYRRADQTQRKTESHYRCRDGRSWRGADDRRTRR